MTSTVGKEVEPPIEADWQEVAGDIGEDDAPEDMIGNTTAAVPEYSAREEVPFATEQSPLPPAA